MTNQRVNFSDTHSTQRTCLNGHIISNHADLEESQQHWCHLCGASTIAECPSCKGPLRGESNYAASRGTPKPESYCLHCGKAFPWTEAHLQAVLEIAQLTNTLNQEDRQTLELVLPDLLSEQNTPRTQVGIVKMKMMLGKGGAIFFETVKKTLVDVVSETAKKALFP